MSIVAKFFQSKDVFYSAKAELFKIDNTPPKEVWENAAITAANLDKLREVLGIPLVVSSWYRCEKLNKAVKGSATSAHRTGFAVDISSNKMNSLVLANKLVEICEELEIKYDQVIYELTWVHISFAPKLRGQKLTYRAGSYTVGFS